MSCQHGLHLVLSYQSRHTVPGVASCLITGARIWFILSDWGFHPVSGFASYLFTRVHSLSYHHGLHLVLSYQSGLAFSLGTRTLSYNRESDLVLSYQTKGRILFRDSHLVSGLASFLITGSRILSINAGLASGFILSNPGLASYVGTLDLSY